MAPVGRKVRLSAKYSAVFLAFLWSTPSTAQELSEYEISDIAYATIGELASGCPPRETQEAFPGEEQGAVAAMSYVRQPLAQGGIALMMAGSVEQGDAQDLDQLLQADPDISELWLHSPGGDAAEGVAIGRVIRKHRLATRVLAHHQCISACTMAFLGGIVRVVESGATYGVHTFYNKELYEALRGLYDGSFIERVPALKSAYLDEQHPEHEQVFIAVEEVRERLIRSLIHSAEQGNALLAADQAVYMSEMGVSRLFLREVVFSQASLLNEIDTSILPEFLSHYMTSKEGGSDEWTARSTAARVMIETHGLRWAEQFRTYMCPTSRQMTQYNVTNVVR